MVLLAPVRDWRFVHCKRRCARENCQYFVVEGRRALLTTLVKEIRWKNEGGLNVILLVLARLSKTFAVLSFSWHN